MAWSNRGLGPLPLHVISVHLIFSPSSVGMSSDHMSPYTCEHRRVGFHDGEQTRRR